MNIDTTYNKLESGKCSDTIFNIPNKYINPYNIITKKYKHFNNNNNYLFYMLLYLIYIFTIFILVNIYIIYLSL